MKQTIADILKREPDEQYGGNIFFRTRFDAGIREMLAAGAAENPKIPWSSEEGYHAWKDKLIRETFMNYWNDRLPGPEGDLRRFPWLDVPELLKIWEQISEDGELVLDLASDFCMGMIPFLLHRYPAVPVCVSDQDMHSMKTLADCLREYLPDYTISVASFDNNNIPIRDNTLPYVTSLDGMHSSVYMERDRQIPVTACCLGREKAIAEVYRILRPGGYFITAEKAYDCDYDLLKLYETSCSDTGQVCGYTYEQLQTVIEWILKDSWRDTFAAAGFEITAEKECFHRLTGYELWRFLQYTHSGKILSRTDWMRTAQLSGKKPDIPEDIGLDIYEGSTLYILRKPE